MKEFVIVTRKNLFCPAFSKEEIASLKGFLLSPRHINIISDVGGRVSGFVASDKPLEGIDLIFDGEAVYNDKLYLDEVDELKGKSLTDFKNNARGSFSVVEISGDGSVFAFHDQLGNYPIYYVSNKEFSGVTNSLLLLESYLKYFFGYELERHAECVVNEMVFTCPLDATSFKNTYFLPFDKEIKIRKSGEVVLSDRKGWEYFFNCKATREELLELCVKDIKENVRAVARSGKPMKIADVTGGMDSRMVLAAIIGSGFKDSFFYHTNGSYPNPDANVSNYLMDKYGLKKARVSNGAGARDNEKIVDRMYTFPYFSGGVKNNIDREPSIFYRNENIIKLGGGNSEFYKGFYSKNIEKIEKRVDVSSITRMMFYYPSSLSKEYAGEKEKELLDIFSHWRDQGLSYESIVDRFYVEYRGRYHNGTCEHWGRAAITKVHPLYTPNTIRLAFSAPHEERISGKITFDLMRSLYQPLVLEPFEKRVWGKEAYAGHALSPKLKGNKPVNMKSKRLSKDPAVLSFVVEPEGGRKEGDVEENNDKKRLSEWNKKQRRLGKKWHWYTLDEFQAHLGKLSESIDFSEVPFRKDYVEKLCKMDLSEMSSIKEVLELHKLCLYFIFESMEEKELVLSSSKSSIKFHGIR